MSNAQAGCRSGIVPNQSAADGRDLPGPIIFQSFPGRRSPSVRHNYQTSPGAI